MRLTRAALLTLRRRRALMIWAGILAIGIPVAVELVLAILHVSDPVTHRPAGGSHTFARMLDTIELLLVVMAAIVGATAGAGDLAAGTFRDLVASGCPRRNLFLARIPAALTVSLGLAAASVGVILAACYSLADGAATPTPSQAVAVVVHVLAVVAVITVMAVGLSELVGSRGIAIGVLLGWLLAGEQLLLSISLLGRGREALVTPALDRLRPFLEAGDAHVIPMSLFVACGTIAAWAAVSAGLGSWKVERRDA
jgi:ABC-type transport system involved in multi-copper enzyme maturation permease subunit